MDRSRERKSRSRCCVYDLDAEQLYRNLPLQEIKSYDDGVMLEDGSVLYEKEQTQDAHMETNKRTLCRCWKCGALFLNDSHYESDMYDSWSCESLYPVTSEEEADLIIILMDGKGTGLPDFRRMIRYGWNFRWIGKEDPRPLDTEKLKEMIREKYAGVNPKLLENLIRKAGQEHMVEKTPMQEPEQKPEPESTAGEGEKDYWYMVNRDVDPPTLIRLGSFARMEADLFAYPGVWKDMPHLNDIRLGMGSAMNYDDISEEEAEEIREKLQEYYDRIPKEGKGAE